jgi:hypothetical protein
MATYTQLTRNEDGEYIRETKTVNTPVKPLTPWLNLHKIVGTKGYSGPPILPTSNPLDQLSLYEPELDIVAYDKEADRTVTIAIMCDDLTERERKYYAELIVKAVNSYEFS